MIIVIGVLGVSLIGATGFGSYMWADAKASRRLVEWNERTNPSTAVLDAIKQSQLQSQAFVSTISSTIAASVKSMLGMDVPTPSYDPIDVAPDPTEPTYKPFAELDPFMNDDHDDSDDTMRPEPRF